MQLLCPTRRGQKNKEIRCEWAPSRGNVSEIRLFVDELTDDLAYCPQLLASLPVHPSGRDAAIRDLNSKPEQSELGKSDLTDENRTSLCW